jgi:Mg/Co/Ni transporter MgtE
MSSEEPRTPLFREEALEFSAAQRGPGELVRVSESWTGRAYWILLALVAAGLTASVLVRFDGEPLLFTLVPALKPLLGPLYA